MSVATIEHEPLSLERINCPLCGARDTRPWGSENGYQAGRCTACGLVYVNPRPTAAEISEANKIGQHRTESGAIDVVYRPSQRKKRYHQRVVKRIFGEELRSKHPLRWLDVGAGYGELMRAVIDLLPPGSKVEGVEPMLPKAGHARAQGLSMASGLHEISGRYDVVSLMNVFSHIPDFDGFLVDIRQVMQPGAILLIETGNGGDLNSATEYPDKLYLPDHLMFAGLKHVEGFLERNGFRLIATEAARIDTLAWSLKSAVKRAIGREAKLVLPYASPFRTVYFKARCTS